MTWDRNPVHFDPELAGCSRFGGMVVPGWAGTVQTRQHASSRMPRCERRVREKPVGHPLCDLVPIGFIEDFVPGTGVDLDLDVGESGSLVPVCDQVNQAASAGQRVVAAA